MCYSKARVAVVALGLAALLAAPTASQGGLCDWLFPSSWGSPVPSATTYAPPYTAQRVTLMPVAGSRYTVASPASYSACSPVGQTCYYVPQTTYRWSYSRIDRTSYRPVTSLDPCTGCPTTVYQPVTRKSLLPWLHRKAVTTYRPVCTNTCTPSSATFGSACCPSGVYGGVIGTAGSVVGSSCPSCGPVTTTPGTISSAPSTDPGYGSPSTFKTEPGTDTTGQGTQSSDLRYRPSSEPASQPASAEEPRLIDPYNRSAAKPIQYATYRQLTERAPSSYSASNAPLGPDGWRASSD